MAAQIEIYIEAGSKRTFAGAIAWPGWSKPMQRGSRRCGPGTRTYRKRPIPTSARTAPRSGCVSTAGAELSVVERLDGNAGTDFGVASVSPSADESPLESAEMDRQVRLLGTCWAAFDRAVAAARGVELRKGPRGGGRDRLQIAAHVVEAEEAYIGQLGVRGLKLPANSINALTPLHEAALDALRARARGELADFGERGGKRWTPRYFVRRAAWHVLDHAWEIEDRSS